MKVPDAVGVPLIVIVFDAKAADTPAGNPDGAPIPVAPVVAIVILGAMAVLTQTVGFDDGVPTVLGELTVTVLKSVAVHPLSAVYVTV